MAVTNVPELYITTDHMRDHAIFEVVTGPIMHRKAGLTKAHEQLTCELMALINYLHKTVRETNKEWLLVRDVIRQFNQGVGRASRCRPLIPTKACLAHEMAIDVKVSRDAMQHHNKEFIVKLCNLVNEPWAKLGKNSDNTDHILCDGMTVYTQHTGSIPIDKLCLDESRDLLVQLIWGESRIQLLKASFRAGNGIVDHFFLPLTNRNQENGQRILRKLRGLMILTFYILHVGLARQDQLDGLVGGSVKNRYDILPRHALRDVVRAALSHNARTLLFQVMTNRDQKAQFYQFISHYLTKALGYNKEYYPLDSPLAFEDQQPTIRQFLDSAFYPSNTERFTGAYKTTQVASTAPGIAQVSAVAVPYPLSKNVDDPREKKPENKAVIRNLLFEARSSMTGTSHSAFCWLAEVQRAKLTEIWDQLSS
jgi:hypothetical protein